MYNWLTFRGIVDTEMQTLWKSPLPLKLKHFLWLAWKNKIQSAAQLRKMGWEGSVNCQLCNLIEDASHIFFHCPMAVFLWNVCKDALSWDRITVNFSDFLVCSFWPYCSKFPRVRLCLLAACCWQLWSIKNDMIFRYILVKFLHTIPFRMICCLLQWRLLLMEEEKETLDTWISELQRCSRNLQGARFSST
uniref:Reverse transcriptase zinc-binding domain-containing protein n=1 Tax=Oryza brachyantha TaxID=4533 RepID=J3MX46_ORYBR